MGVLKELLADIVPGIIFLGGTAIICFRVRLYNVAQQRSPATNPYVYIDNTRIALLVMVVMVTSFLSGILLRLPPR